MSNPFFKNQGPIKILEILKLLKLENKNLDNNYKIHDIKDLFTSTKNDITFYHSKKYKELAKKTKASFCLTTLSLKNGFNIIEYLSKILYSFNQQILLIIFYQQ